MAERGHPFSAKEVGILIGRQQDKAVPITSVQVMNYVHRAFLAITNAGYSKYMKHWASAGYIYALLSGLSEEVEVHKGGILRHKPPKAKSIIRRRTWALKVKKNYYAGGGDYTYYEWINEEEEKIDRQRLLDQNKLCVECNKRVGTWRYADRTSYCDHCRSMALDRVAGLRRADRM